MPNDDGDRRWTLTDIGEQLGFSEAAVKKWRRYTRRALRKAGQLDCEAPTVPLPRNALPLPANHREHVRDGLPPRWDPEVVIRWAERTERRHPETGATTHPSPPGRPRSRGTSAELVAAA